MRTIFQSTAPLTTGLLDSFDRSDNLRARLLVHRMAKRTGFAELAVRTLLRRMVVLSRRRVHAGLRRRPRRPTTSALATFLCAGPQRDSC